MPKAAVCSESWEHLINLRISLQGVHNWRQTFCNEFNQQMSNWSAILMPQKKGYQQTQSDWQQATFCVINVNKEQASEFRHWWKEEAGDLGDLLQAYCYNGYKLSLKWDGDHSCFIATFTQWQEGSPNKGKCLSARSDNWAEAVALLIYKTEFLCEKQTWPFGALTQQWG